MRRSVPDNKDKMTCPSCKKKVDSFFFHVERVGDAVWDTKREKFIVELVGEEVDSVYCPNCREDVIGKSIFGMEFPEWDWEGI
jgi:hypothetical protein